MSYDVKQYSKKAIGERIRKTRHKRNMSLCETSALCYMTEPALSKLENGQSYPSLVTVAKLAEVLNVSTDTIILGEEPLTCAIYIQMRNQEELDKFKKQFNEFLINGGNENNDESEISVNNG